MINKAIAKIFGTQNEREIKRLMPIVAQINALEPQVKQFSDDQLRAKTDEFRAKIQERLAKYEEAEHKNHALKEVLDEILPEAFAICREAGWRVLNMRHFDVQLIGGMVLHSGRISEMKTGEGKTLVATLPVYLNALSGRGVHVVTVNDYLAKRDSEWMGKLYNFLGLSVGVIVHDLDDDQRREAYRADVTYGTNNEFGFDYLRDNMKFELSDCVQREFNFAIVDEVDSILIDEARTPLIISGASEESTDKYQRVNVIIPRLEKGEEIEGREPGDKILTGDYVVDEKHKTITVSDDGWEKVEKLLGIGNIADPENWDLKHHVEVAIKAHALYHVDVEYVVKDGEVLIVDEFTGRLMPGRRWSDGLHQAVEAKEGVKVERENQTLATITFQNYFRLYKKLAGMTGTAETEAAEFDKIYKLEVVVIPTNRTLLRKENPDVVYRTEKEKFFAVADEIAKLSVSQQPVLVGTVSIEKSERLSELLKRKNIKHVVLNAKFHEREAEYVAQAGRLGQVTIATNMAGRGTDILLGGNPEFMAKQETLKKGVAQPVHAAGGEVDARPDDPNTVYWYYAGNEYVCPRAQWEEILAHYKTQTDFEHEQVKQAGGLFILGTERHESRRIDNQLRGRAGRQGDPGASRFYLSLEDDLMRIFAKEWVSTLLQRLGMEEGVPIESKMISRRIEKAQEAVEAQNFEARKHLLEYDDVMNKQRMAVYGLRRQLLEGLDQKELIIDEYVTEILGDLLDKFAPTEKHPEDWDIAGLKGEIFTRFGVDIIAEGVEPEKLNRMQLGDGIFDKLKERYEAKEQLIGNDQMRHHERVIMLSVIDQLWKDHLLNMDHLKEGIGLRGYAQHDPLVEYKRESFDMFEGMMATFKEQTVRYLYLMQIIDAATNMPVEIPRRRAPENVRELGPVLEAENAPEPQISGGNGQQPPQRRQQTSLDDLEKQFERKKKRELEQARMAGGGMPDAVQQVVRSGDKIGRNDPCFCGSGKKYKKCHGA
ncbi:protein translocase subunit secA [Candidatus Koribacter versatilis Ellin345]|uniref:Protein translocase subunit SecA n=1 Tax=Koribacter versatilis (strain Ellin345) TaxID=204669 RepID=SECA_KORVE|nr:preprotein translocase subunit SecA [Candidatus Koribacter versatilis]Q1IMP4.1 RecName: Full=Protein translocase subunit SecA [Candidatus Koribacter versatilis Ellin345]ABF41856.1 protein translocase subunit secA [Candidatus Koribacter versatilis Ellin345]